MRRHHPLAVAAVGALAALGLAACSGGLTVAGSPAPSGGASATSAPAVTPGTSTPPGSAGQRCLPGGGVAISYDANTTTADFDGAGWSYSAEALSAAGLTPGAAVTVGGTTFTWPQAPPGTVDNITAAGQAVPLSGTRSGPSELGFLGAGAHGQVSATITVNYTDATTAQASLTWSDWTLDLGHAPLSASNTVVATMPYQNNATLGSHLGSRNYVFAAFVPVDPARTVASVSLPSQPDLHLFDVAEPGVGSVLSQFTGHQVACPQVTDTLIDGASSQAQLVS
jgi:hypothetical protein